MSNLNSPALTKLPYFIGGHIYGNYRGTGIAARTDGSGDLLSYRVPTSREGGIWAPAGPAIDAAGRLYVSVGNEAFWTSTRPGGFGGNDIWTSRRVDGKWTEPENLGPSVNGPGDEHHPIPTRDEDGKWEPLVNLGPIINGPGDDRCPAWTPDFKIFLFDSTRGDGFGSLDLWWVYFKAVQGYSLVESSD